MRVLAFVAVGSMALSGCATLDRGMTDKVFFVSVPVGASVTTSRGQACTTPCEIDEGRGDAFTATIAKAGYLPQRVHVTTRLNSNGVGDFIENVATGGLGMVVDAGTGATLEHIPNPVIVKLTASGLATRTKGPMRG